MGLKNPEGYRLFPCSVHPAAQLISGKPPPNPAGNRKQPGAKQGSGSAVTIGALAPLINGAANAWLRRNIRQTVRRNSTLPALRLCRFPPAPHPEHPLVHFVGRGVLSLLLPHTL